MGWRDMRKRSVTGSVPDWQAWAGQKRWEYREPASDLAGRFYPAPTGPDRVRITSRPSRQSS